MGLQGRLETRDVMSFHLKLRAECLLILTGAELHQLTYIIQYTKIEEIHMHSLWHFWLGGREGGVGGGRN